MEEGGRERACVRDPGKGSRPGVDGWVRRQDTFCCCC